MDTDGATDVLSDFEAEEQPRSGPQVEIVTHCYRYSRLLCYQLSSLLAHPPSVTTRITVFHEPGDEKTVEMLKFFAGEFVIGKSDVLLRPWVLDRDKLLRRAIGRNMLALTTDAEIVWYADADMLFGPGCIDGLYEAYDRDEVLCFPRIVHKTTDGYTVGDRMIEAITKPQVVDVVGKASVAQSLFEPVRQDVAIGGCQILKGSTLNRIGYLPESRRYQRPTKIWRRTFEDPVFRKSVCGGRGYPIDVPNVFRIRHSRIGRVDRGCEN